MYNFDEVNERSFALIAIFAMSMDPIETQLCMDEFY